MGHILLSFLFYNIVLLIIYRHYKRGEYYINKKNLFYYTLLLIGFGTFGNGEGDYLHYRDTVEMFQSFADVLSDYGMELQYNYLAYYVGGNYTLWRLVIFSIEFIGMSLMLYKAKLNTYPVLLSFIAICLVLYTYQRSYWGVIFYFLGLYLLFKKKNPLFLIIIALAYFAHTQNLVLLALLPLGFVKIKSWQLVLVFLMIGTLATVLGDFISSIINSGGIEGADYINNKLSAYDGGKISYFGSSLGEVLIFILRYIPVLILTLLFVKTIMISRGKYINIESPYRSLMNLCIGIVITSVVVLFASLGTGTYFYRILSMSLFPISILLPYMYENKLLTMPGFNTFVSLYILVAELGYVKDIYYAFSSGVY